MESALRRASWLLLALLWPATVHAASTYALINGATSTQSAPTPNLIVSPQSTFGGPLQNQAFVVSVTGQSNSSPSCTVQFLGAITTDSAGNPIWTTYGSTVTANAGNGGSATFAAAAFGNIPFVYYGAIVTAISGTGATCSASMNG